MNTSETTPEVDLVQVRRTVAYMAEEMPQVDPHGEEVIDPDVASWINGGIGDEDFANADEMYKRRRSFMILVKRVTLEAPDLQPNEVTMSYIKATMGGIQSVHDLSEQLGS